MGCKPILIEPVMNMEIVVPSDHVGDVMGDINAKRGKIQGVDPADDTQIIRAHVPMAEVLNYAADLTSLTGGAGYVCYGIRSLCGCSGTFDAKNH